MGCCDNIIKCMVFLVNFAFVAAGIAIITIGTLMYLNYQDISKILESNISSPPIALIVLGSIIFVIAFFGCCGAVTQNSCMLNTYAVALLILFVAQVTIGVLVFVYGDSIDQSWRTVLKKEFDNAGQDKASFDFFNSLQSQLKCCGVDSPLDYGLNPSVLPLYKSCCASDTKVCIIPEYKSGCGIVFEEWIANNAIIIGGVAIGISILELLGSACGFAMASWVSKRL